MAKLIPLTPAEVLEVLKVSIAVSSTLLTTALGQNESISLVGDKETSEQIKAKLEEYKEIIKDNAKYVEKSELMLELEARLNSS